MPKECNVTSDIAGLILSVMEYKLFKSSSHNRIDIIRYKHDILVVKSPNFLIMALKIYASVPQFKTIHNGLVIRSANYM